MKSLLHRSRTLGYSLPEVMVTIAIVGILAAIALATFGNVNESTRLVVAQKIAAQLNAGVKGYNQSNWDMPTAKDDSATTDEFLVLRSLQNAPTASSGSFQSLAPFYSPGWNPTSSSAVADYRIRWNGVSFELLAPGQSGQGLKVTFDGTDQGAAYTYPSNYKIEGAR